MDWVEPAKPLKAKCITALKSPLMIASRIVASTCKPALAPQHGASPLTSASRGNRRRAPHVQLDKSASPSHPVARKCARAFHLEDALADFPRWLAPITALTLPGCATIAVARHRRRRQRAQALPFSGTDSPGTGTCTNGIGNNGTGYGLGDTGSSVTQYSTLFGPAPGPISNYTTFAISLASGPSGSCTASATVAQQPQPAGASTVCCQP